MVSRKKFSMTAAAVAFAIVAGSGLAASSASAAPVSIPPGWTFQAYFSPTKGGCQAKMNDAYKKFRLMGVQFKTGESCRPLGAAGAWDAYAGSIVHSGS